jgi:hypothetical protein
MAFRVRYMPSNLLSVVLLNVLISLSKLPIFNEKCVDQCISMRIKRYLNGLQAN